MAIFINCLKPSKLNYNYIFLFEDISYVKLQYNDLKKSNSAQFVPIKILSWQKDKKNIKNFMCHLHLSTTINRVISLPFKGIWAKSLFNFSAKPSMDKEKPFCFVIDARCYEKYDNTLIRHLKNDYKNCKMVLYFTDIISTYKIHLEKAKNVFDSILTFEYNDSVNHNIFHYDNPYSKINITSTLPKSDIFFIGQNKNRLRDIIYTYETLSKNGISCDFNIVNVDEKDRILENVINYTNFMDYSDIIRHILSSCCILELLQDKASSPTLRTLEAVCYNKKLLTNCKSVINKNYYNPDFISIFDTVKNIEIDFIKNQSRLVEYNYCDKLSPLEMVKFINDDILS